jgi:cytochrome P450
MKKKYPPIASRFRSLINANRFIKNPIPILDEAVDRLGPTYTFFMGGMEKAIMTIDPVASRYILQKHHRAYEKSAIVTDILARYTGHGLLTSTGDHWLRQRRLIQPGFQRRRIESLQGLMQQELDACMQNWKVYAAEGKRFDAYAEMNQLTFRIVARALFSTSIEEHGLEQLSTLISQLQDYIIREVRQPHKRWWFRWSGIMAHHEKLAQGARDLIRGIIVLRKQEATKPDDLLTMLLESTYEDTGDPMHEEQLIDECLILFVAGHETSANALSWMIYLLGKNPVEFQKIKSASGDTQATLVRNVIFESMRLYPPGWVIDRISLADDTVGEFQLPKGTVWIIYIRGMHRHPDYWKDPEAFLPDRWLDPAINKDAYMPFGAGPRLCIGEHFAMMEMQLILTEIVSKWNFTLHVEKVEEKPLVTLRPGSEILISLQ